MGEREEKFRREIASQAKGISQKLLGRRTQEEIKFLEKINERRYRGKSQ